ncbi:MAG TPA: hypothetical protein VFG23_17060, partial [Polyangia bacterium]|nr:hypothetical protein [Polyangia bacterium]
MKVASRFRILFLTLSTLCVSIGFGCRLDQSGLSAVVAAPTGAGGAYTPTGAGSDGGGPVFSGAAGQATGAA